MKKPIHRPEYDAVRTLLRDIRLEAGLHQAELSAALGKPQPYISNIETGDRRIDIIEIRDICVVAGVTLPAFVERLEKAIRLHAKTKLARKPAK
jgi:transcriptional regulator with XRE-family HTH domain